MGSLAEIHNRTQLKGKKGFWDWEKSGVDFRVDVGSHAGDRVCRLMYESEQKAEELTILLEAV